MMHKTLAGQSAKAFTGSPFSRDQQTSDQLDHMMLKSFQQHVGGTDFGTYLNFTSWPIETNPIGLNSKFHVFPVTVNPSLVQFIVA